MAEAMKLSIHTHGSAAAGALVLALGATGLAATPKASAPIPIPPAKEIIARLKPGHPRLLLDRAGFQALRLRSQKDPLLRRWRRDLHAEAARILGQSPSRYEIPDGLRLLSTSRRVLRRVSVLALMHWLEGDPRCAARAWRELDAAARFPDWNPRHFLDTAEMTHAFAIGYDWLYSVWTPEQRKILREAMVRFGLGPAKAAYEGRERYGWWTRAHHNWNQVCNGGVGMGALAIGDETPDLAGQLLHEGLRSIQLAMTQFAPDGAWAEGPGYWNYATSYNVAFLAALQTALGTDYGLSDIPGFALCGRFPVYITGPVNRTFNYADGGDRAPRAPQLFWLARRFRQPDYARYEVERAAPAPADLIWFDRSLLEGSAALPLNVYFRKAEVVTLRGAWRDPAAWFVGFKAGDNKANHSHLDLGTFVLDALGQRWGLDLGADNYNLPGYFGGKRWTYYRLRAEGHNTLVINPGKGPDQNPRAAARIVKFRAEPEDAAAVADLTPAYAAHAQSVQRGIRLIKRRAVLVQDEVRAKSPANLWWFFHTRAAIQIAPDGRSARLSQGGKTLEARLLAPAGARFRQMAAEPLPSSPRPSGQAVNRGVRKLAVHLQGATDTRLAILFQESGKARPALKIEPLAAW